MVFCANCVWKVISFLFLNCAASFFDLKIWGDLEQKLEGFPRLLWLWPRCNQSHWSRYCEKREVADLLTRISFGGCKQKINERKGTSIRYLFFRRGVAPTWPHPSKFQRCVVLATFFVFCGFVVTWSFILPQGFRRYSSIFFEQNSCPCIAWLLLATLKLWGECSTRKTNQSFADQVLGP